MEWNGMIQDVVLFCVDASARRGVAWLLLALALALALLEMCKYDMHIPRLGVCLFKCRRAGKRNYIKVLI